MNSEPDAIRTQMDQTRADLSDKLKDLETRVTEGMQTTGAVVSETMSSVKEAVETVSETLDFRQHVQDHPWIAVGGAVALGYLAATLLDRPSQRSAPQYQNSSRAAEGLGAAPRPSLITPLLDLVQDWAVQGLPLAINYLFNPANGQTGAPISNSDAGAQTLPLSSKTNADGNWAQNRKII